MEITAEREIEAGKITLTYDIDAEVEESKFIGGSDDLGRHEVVKEYHIEFTTNLTWSGIDGDEITPTEEQSKTIDAAIKKDIKDNYYEIVTDLEDSYRLKQ